MSRQARAATKPELALRSALHSRGVRFRVNDPRLPGRPDVVLVKLRLAVFVDGCFWHACPEHGVLPRANREWWSEKLRRNRERDERDTRALGDLGWQVLRVWEHEDATAVADELATRWHLAG